MCTRNKHLRSLRLLRSLHAKPQKARLRSCGIRLLQGCRWGAWLRGGRAHGHPPSLQRGHIAFCAFVHRVPGLRSSEPVLFSRGHAAGLLPRRCASLAFIHGDFLGFLKTDLWVFSWLEPSVSHLITLCRGFPGFSLRTSLVSAHAVASDPLGARVRGGSELVDRARYVAVSAMRVPCGNVLTHPFLCAVGPPQG